MSTVVERFQKAKEIWTNKKAILDQVPAGLTTNEYFHVAYHATNTPATRCIYLKIVPETDKFGHSAVFLHQTNQFYQVEATDRGLEITVWCNEDIASGIDAILDKLKQGTIEFGQKVISHPDKKVDLLMSINIEEIVDEVINRAMNLDPNQVVYFSIGKTREFAANIPLLMNASGFSLVQLSMNKWMTAGQQLRQSAPDEPFPKDKAKPLIADALKWKKYVIDFLNGTW